MVDTKLIIISQQLKKLLINIGLPNINFEYDYSKEYCGKIIKQNNEFTLIKISILKNKSIKRLTETIAHEYAHITFWNHTAEHYNLTQKYLKYLCTNI